MTHKYITFREFTQTYISHFPDEFRYLETPVQIYSLEKLFSNNISTPTPLLKANFNYIIFLTKGCFEQQVGSEIKKVLQNEALFVVQGEISSLLTKSNDIGGYYMIFDDTTMQKLRADLHFIELYTVSPVIKLDKNEIGFLRQNSELIIQELMRTEADQKILLLLFQALLLKFFKKIELPNDLSRQLEIAVSFRELVYKYYSQKLSIAEYADKLNISSNYLNRCVKNIWRKSSRQFAQEVAIVQSQNYLDDFSISISEIAYLLNFNDPSYFSRLFKKIMRISPIEYRKQKMGHLPE